MLSKIKKGPQYFQGFWKRIKSIGFYQMIKELYAYNKVYYFLLKKNNNAVNYQTILFHIAFYSKIVSILPNISRQELLEYIPSTITNSIYKRLNINRKDITYDKYRMYLRMQQNEIPIPEIFFVSDSQCNNLWSNLISIFSFHKYSINKKILAKPRFANAGEGIHIYENGEIKPNYIYQEFILNHPSIIELQGNEFCSTIRYVLYNKNVENQMPVGATIRLNAGKIIDHPHSGAICATVDCMAGEIISDGYYANGKTTKTHPITGISIKGFVIPNWNHCLSVIEATCFEYSELPLIAFDLAITADNCVILEINAGGATLAYQYSKRWLNHQFVKDFYPKIINNNK